MISHWDEVEYSRRDRAHIGGTWASLTDDSSVTVGVTRMLIDPGKWSTPAHIENSEEEIFFVLAGSGLSWQEGECYEVGPGDCLVHWPGAYSHTLRAGESGRIAHSFLAGDEALILLAYGTRDPNDVAYYLRSGKIYFRGVGLMARVEPLGYWNGEVDDGS